MLAGWLWPLRLPAAKGAAPSWGLFAAQTPLQTGSAWLGHSPAVTDIQIRFTVGVCWAVFELPDAGQCSQTWVLAGMCARIMQGHRQVQFADTRSRYWPLVTEARCLQQVAAAETRKQVVLLSFATFGGWVVHCIAES